MGFTQIIEYTDVEVTQPPPVKKQIWDGEKFVPMTLYKIKGLPAIAAQKWLLETFGPKKIYRDGRYWEYSRAGDFTVMDEKVYTWYQMKWGNK